MSEDNMPEQAAPVPPVAPRSFITGVVSQEGRTEFQFNGAWSDLFTLMRLIEMEIGDRYKEEQRRMAAQPIAPPAKPQRPESFAERREKKGKRK